MLESKKSSRSDVQRSIQEIMFKKIREILGNTDLVCDEKIPIVNVEKTYICPDFYSEEGKVIGEIHAHAGGLKKAQHDKIAGDVLKMLLYEKSRGCEFKKYIAVCCREEYEQLTGASYLAEAMRQFGVSVLLVDIPEDAYRRLQECMKKQNLIK